VRRKWRNPTATILGDVVTLPEKATPPASAAPPSSSSTHPAAAAAAGGSWWERLRSTWCVRDAGVVHHPVATEATMMSLDVVRPMSPGEAMVAMRSSRTAAEPARNAAESPGTPPGAASRRAEVAAEEGAAGGGAAVLLRRFHGLEGT
jgi:hypothetical protein